MGECVSAGWLAFAMLLSFGCGAILGLGFAIWAGLKWQAKKGGG